MMFRILFIILLCFICSSCGVKDNPTYKSNKLDNKIIKLV